MLRCISVADWCGSSETMCCVVFQFLIGVVALRLCVCVVFQFLISVVALRLCVALYFSC